MLLEVDTEVVVQAGRSLVVEHILEVAQVELVHIELIQHHMWLEQEGECIVVVGYTWEQKLVDMEVGHK